MGKLLFSFGPFHLNLKEKDTGEHIYVLERIDARPVGVWPHVTVFPTSNLHGGLDIHLTWEEGGRKRRESLARISHDDIKSFAEPFNERWQAALRADLRRVSLSELARQEYIALFTADEEKTLDFFKSLAPMGPKNRRKVDLSPFEHPEEMLAGTGYVDPRRLPGLLNDGVIKDQLISCVRLDEALEPLLLYPVKTRKGWAWFARPTMTVGGAPVAEAAMRLLFKALPESFGPNLLRVIDEMGMREFGVDTADFERDWARARAKPVESQPVEPQP